jgi:hypothetical protein
MTVVLVFENGTEENIYMREGEVTRDVENYVITTLITLSPRPHNIKSNRPWRPRGLRDVKDPTLSGQSTHRWR